MNRISFVILAAGKSRRMKSTKSKVLHNTNERPIINYVNDIKKKKKDLVGPAGLEPATTRL